MTPAIGAGTIIKMGTGAAPNNTANGGAASDAALTDVTEYFMSMGFSRALNAIDVTKLNVGSAEEFSRQFLAGLAAWTANGNFGDNVQGTFLRRIIAIANGVLHAKGRGKVDMIILVGGAVTGNLRVDFTAIFTSNDFMLGTEDPIGGAFSIQVDGKLALSTQA